MQKARAVTAGWCSYFTGAEPENREEGQKPSEGENRLIGKHRGQARVPRGEDRGRDLLCEGREEHVYDLELHLLYIT